MKKFFAPLLVLSFLSLAACVSSTPQGECIGALDTGDETLRYQTSSWNVGVAITSWLLPPIGLVTTGFVVGAYAKCPIGPKTPRASL